MARLQAFLNQALAGQGQVCFVAGEAGAGKTALVTEFARRAQLEHANLVVASANCNTQSGVGDAYLPFRELFTRLIGLAQASAREDAIGEEASGRPDLALESVAGLARIALARSDMAQAQAYAEELVAEFDDATFPNHGKSEEFLTCYRVLQANGDARAEGVLGTIYNQIQAGAAKIGDAAMRRSYLENVPAHREIVAEWHALQRSQSGDSSSQTAVIE